MVDHKRKLSGPHFIFSAENPKHPEHNQLKLTHEQVLHHLKGAGYDAHEMQGHYGSPEKSIAVYGTSPQHQEALHGLAAKLGQDSSIHSTGQKHEMRFHHGTEKGKKVSGQGTQWHNQKPKDLFTSLPGGTDHFTHNFDFGKSEDSRQNLTHFSSKEGLTHVDPKHQGSGVDARTKGRESEHPHSFYYREGTEPESVVTGQSSHKYTASIHPKENPLYDIGKDPHGFVPKVKEENQGALSMDRLHAKIKDAGYHGFHNTNHPSLSNVVAMYHPLKVERHERTK